jgi:cobalt-zinc-cadmium efflux system outer membrane protein
MREIDRERTESEFATARTRLALQWGGAATFDSLALPEPPLVAAAAGAATEVPPEHPDLARVEAEHRQSEWRVRHARAARMPDVEVAAGIRHFTGPGETGFLAGVSVPLPVWNARGGEIAAAEAEREAAETIVTATRRTLEADAIAARHALDSAVSRWVRVRDDVRPVAAQAMEGVAEAYRAGRIGYLDLQEGQRGLVEAELLTIETQAEVWRAHYRLEALIRPLGGAR